MSPGGHKKSLVQACFVVPILTDCALNSLLSGPVVTFLGEGDCEGLRALGKSQVLHGGGDLVPGFWQSP